MQKFYQENWKPIEFEFKELYIVSRISQVDNFQVRKVIPLGNNENNKPFFEEIPL